MPYTAAFTLSESIGGRSQSSCCFWPITRVIRRRNSAWRRCGRCPATCTLPRAGVDQAAKHLQGGGFAGTIGPQEAHHLAGLNRKRNILHRRHIPGAALNEMAQSSSQAGLLLGNPVGLAQPLNLNHVISSGRPGACGPDRPGPVSHRGWPGIPPPPPAVPYRQSWGCPTGPPGP